MTSGKRTTKSESNALLTLFIKCYEERYGSKPIVNRYRERWGFQDMIDSVGYATSEEIIKFYFSVPATSHTCKHLFYNFDDMQRNMYARDRDRIDRQILREQTKRRMEESRDSRG